MIVFLEGTLVEKQPTRAVLNVEGVGYEVFIPLSTYDALPTENNACRILTYEHVREDLHALYGFATEAERRMFLLLLLVTGVGPKIALGALSGITVRDLKVAVVQGDVKRISSISGIGKKTAERVIMELRDKLSEGEALEAVSGAPELSATDTRTRDALLALISLGYKQAEAQKLVQTALTALKPDAGVEDLIRRALAR
jgi:holliday junction DNA helicase RuvA